MELNRRDFMKANAAVAAAAAAGIMIPVKNVQADDTGIRWIKPLVVTVVQVVAC